MPSGQTDETLDAPPAQFFMSLRDLAFWWRSARADARLARLRKEHGDQAAFDLLYRDQPDPWGAASDQFRYQGLKYRRLIGLLPRRRFASVLDIGCGLGVFSRLLAAHADRVLGFDFAAAAVEQARQASVEVPNVTFEEGDILHLEALPDGGFDLVVIADVLYYLSPLSDEVVTTIAQEVARLLAPGGVLLLANHCFFGWDAESRQTRHMHRVVQAAADWQRRRERWRPFYLASVLHRGP